MPMGKVFEQIRQSYVVESNFIKFAVLKPQLTQLQSQPSYTQFTIGSKLRKLLFSDNLSALT